MRESLLTSVKEENNNNEEIENEQEVNIKCLLTPRPSIFQQQQQQHDQRQQQDQQQEDEVCENDNVVESVLEASVGMMRKNLQEGYDLLESTLSFRYVFHTSWTTYLVFMSFLGGLIMFWIEGGESCSCCCCCSSSSSSFCCSSTCGYISE